MIADEFIGEPAELAVQRPLRHRHHVVESAAHKVLQIAPADIGVLEGRPGDAERVHAVALLEDMGHEPAVLAAAAWHDHVVVTGARPMAIAQRLQFLLPRLPVYAIVLDPGPLAGGANPALIETEPRLLVRDDAIAAEANPLRQIRELAVERDYHRSLCARSQR
jgi:hypothetical protein